MEITLVETVLERLNVLCIEKPGLREAAGFYQRLIPVMHSLRKDIPGIAIEQEALKQKFSAGVPLLVDELLEFEPIQSRKIFESIGAVVWDTRDEASRTEQKALEIKDAIERGGLDPLPLLSAVDNGDARLLAETASRLGLDPPMLEMLAQNTLKVFLHAWRAALEAYVDLEDWRRGACPFCGADAALAENRGVEGTRYLRCLRCGAGWPYPNLRCAFCGNEDHRSLGILMIDSQPRKNYAHTCDHCKRYIKTVITFEPIPVDLLMIEDLATVQLDCLASERGFAK